MANCTVNSYDAEWGYRYFIANCTIAAIGAVGNFLSLWSLFRCRKTNVPAKIQLGTFFGVQLAVCLITLPGFSFIKKLALLCQAGDQPMPLKLFFLFTHTLFLPIERINFTAMSIYSTLPLYKLTNFFKYPGTTPQIPYRRSDDSDIQQRKTENHRSHLCHTRCEPPLPNVCQSPGVFPHDLYDDSPETANGSPSGCQRNNHGPRGLHYSLGHPCESALGSAPHLSSSSESQSSAFFNYPQHFLHARGTRPCHFCGYESTLPKSSA
ncbi:hypothetical protein SK128_003498 [Halocaridina rubra]|uniref:Uncharacterized protein n=1 Tax=Halocaridina rubra TaxID=373956 RepID=A0AAN9A889_HALRR